ncbi:MAG: NAD(P)/FAD-dependent oxidoreductase [Myxococcota bacterium]
MTDWDFAVIGGGIAGASVAYELQARAHVVLLEGEAVPGYHTTGRSAAFLVESYGTPVVGRLTRAGRSFFEHPPPGFSPVPLVHPRPVLWIAREDQRESLRAALARGRSAGADLRSVEGAEAEKRCPVLRSGSVAEAVSEPAAMSIDVAALLDGFLRGFRGRGGTVLTRARVTRIERGEGGFELEAGGRVHRVRGVVDAAGAWCDTVASLAGVSALGLRPLRRTVITFDPPPDSDLSDWPCVIDADERFYLKPEGACLLASPCDETPSEPCDVVPEEYDVALAVDRIESATTLRIEHLRRRWAGLRTFAPDRSPVIGEDPDCPGFFWLAGQGGFGIMTSPAAARIAASLILDRSLPPDVEALGLTPAALSPARLRAARGSSAPAASPASRSSGSSG